MTRRIRRWVSIAVLGVLAFSQATLVFATCAMDRADIAQMMTTPGDDECCDQAGPPACIVQSTSDLQAPVAFVPLLRPAGPIPRRVEPPGTSVPPRILLHSFLI